MGLSFRAYFFLVGLFALWVGVWGYFVPGEVSRALPWTLPPMHARFIAAMYLAGLAAMTLALLARQLATVRIPIALAVVWTGGLFVASMLNLEAFDFAKPQVWFWMGAYAVFPLWGAWLYMRGGAGRTAQPSRSFDAGLVVVAVACLALGVAMLVAPAAVVGFWPWKVTPLLANIYAGPFLAWGVSAWLLARESRRESRRIVLVAMLVFTVLGLLASWLHLALFKFEAPAAWAWFGGLAVWALIALLGLLRRERR